MSAALAGTSVAVAMTPAAANAVQCFKGSLHVCGQRRAQAAMRPTILVSLRPSLGRPLLVLKTLSTAAPGNVFVILALGFPKAWSAIGVACHRSINVW